MVNGPMRKDSLRLLEIGHLVLKNLERHHALKFRFYFYSGGGEAEMSSQ